MASDIGERLQRLARGENDDLSVADEADEEIERLRTALATAIGERDQARLILAHTDIGSLPNDWTLVQIAEARIDDLMKLRDQVRDTCRRAEQAEREVGRLREVEAFAMDVIEVLRGESDAARARAEQAEGERDAAAIQGLGFAFAHACALLDKGIDPREYEVPKLLELWQSRLSAALGEVDD